MIRGAILGLLVAIGLGESKAQGAAIGAAVGYGVTKLWSLTPMGQRAAAEQQARLEQMRARMEQRRLEQGL